MCHQNLMRHRYVMVSRKNKGATMNKLLIALLALTLLSGCGQNEPAAEAPAAPQASETEAAAASAAPPADPVIDYVWNSTAEGMTDEQLMDIAARWNARIDAAGYDMVGANILKPQFETDDYDVIWTLLWPSSEAREAAWADWNANQLADWNAELDGALSYEDGNIYTFKPAGGWESSVAALPQGGTFIPNFSFCSFNEGFSEDSIATFREAYDAGLAEADSGNYGYYILEPQFEQNEADLVWLDLFADAEAMQEGSDTWSGSELEAQWNDMVTCQSFTFAATAIRR